MDNQDPTGNSSSSILTSIEEQAKDLCQLHDHPTRIIANLDIPTEELSDYDNPKDATYNLDGIVQLFLYKLTRNFSQLETVRRMRGAAYIYSRFDLSKPPTQACISYNWKYRFSREERQLIEKAADRLREVCAEYDILDTHSEPPLEPDDLVNQDIAEEQIMEAVERATKLGFTEFTDPRANNCKYALQAYFERQGYLNMAQAGTTTKRRRFARLSDRNEVPHGSSHNRTMKKVATPNKQLSLDEFPEENRRIPDWKRIRDKVLSAFHAGVERQLTEIAGRDRAGVRDPVLAAIDITTFNFWPSPTKSKGNIELEEEPVVNEKGEFYPKDDFPEMVSGFKDENKKETERGYKFATLTIVTENTPIVLAIEPVRDYSWWERKPREDVETTSRAEIVEQLMEQAEQHVDIHKMFCDREFDSHGVRDALDRMNVQYVIGKRRQSSTDYENIEEIIEDDVYDSRIEHAWAWYNGRKHKLSIIYLPGGEYSLFTVNGWVDPHRAEGLTTQYRQRWMIENEYKSIKENFLPQTATKDYRIRFLYFVIGVMMYNVWRLANFLLRDEVDINLGETPPLLAGEIVELVGVCLFDPGG